MARKPRGEGVQTTIVVGPAGEEIYTEEHAQAKVGFHWDRAGEANEKSSRWIRISKAWSGAAWGAMSLQRIGQEVIVDFLEGDSDRPIITGRVYHGTSLMMLAKIPEAAAEVTVHTPKHLHLK
jgi:type VI secretion system secreted protein VgrG